MVRDSGLWSFFFGPPSLPITPYTTPGAPIHVVPRLLSQLSSVPQHRHSTWNVLTWMVYWCWLMPIFTCHLSINWLLLRWQTISHIIRRFIPKWIVSASWKLWMFILFRVIYQTRQLYALNAPVLLTQFSAHPSIWFQNDILRPMTIHKVIPSLSGCVILMVLFSFSVSDTIFHKLEYGLIVC